MPQWRKLWTKTTESQDFNDMPNDFYRLLWVLLPLVCCREGRGLDNPAWIKAKAMPMRSDVGFEQVDEAMSWYACHNMIIRYEANGRRYFAIHNWRKYQGDTSRESQSDYPEPTHDQLTTNSRPTHDLLVTSSRSDADADACIDTDAEEKNMGASAPPTSPISFTDWLTAIQDPPSIQESNKVAVLVRMGQALYAHFPRDQSAYKRVGALAKKAGSASKLAAVFWDNASKPLAAPLDYLTAAVNGGAGHGNDPPEQAKALNPGEYESPDDFFGGQT